MMGTSPTPLVSGTTIHDCPHCGGTGRVTHRCAPVHMLLVHTLDPVTRIRICRDCGQLWKTTCDFRTCLKPGETRGELAFTHDEAHEHFDSAALVLLKYRETQPRRQY